MIYYYIMHACSKPERYGQARFVEKVNIHAASANANAKKSGRVPRSAAEKPRKDSADFFHFWREKVSVLELSDDFGTARGPFLLVGETVVSPTA